MAAPHPPPRPPALDLAGLGAELQRAVRARVRRRRSRTGAVVVAGLAAAGLAGTAGAGAGPGRRPAPAPPAADGATPARGTAPPVDAGLRRAAASPPPPPAPPPAGVVPDPSSLLVLVDRQRSLPPGWAPAELVEPAVPFTFSGPDPKRLLRPEAARALEDLFAAAAAAGLPLAAVSGYRSEETQRNVHSASVARHGAAAADRVSARPGHSEHQTGLAVDVTGADGACPAAACFAARPEARWLAAHAADHGFVVRYPPGAEAVTGYEHEPWHLRYVGRAVAAHLARTGLTLDQLRGAAPPTRR